MELRCSSAHVYNVINGTIKGTSRLPAITIGRRSLASFQREALQEYLERLAKKGLSHSVVSHLRWDLRQIFQMTYAEGYLSRNPAMLLFVPRIAERAPQRIMSLEEVKQLFSLFGLRERLIVNLGTLCGMRPGEIFSLKWGNINE